MDPPSRCRHEETSRRVPRRARNSVGQPDNERPLVEMTELARSQSASGFDGSRITSQLAGSPVGTISRRNLRAFERIVSHEEGDGYRSALGAVGPFPRGGRA